MDSWLSHLADDDTHNAWASFVARYRALILATIRHFATDDDEIADVFSTVCEALSANDFARLRQYSAAGERRARVSTWLVAVVRNITIDWLRQRDGRGRAVVPGHLTLLQQEIYRAICHEGQTHVEAFETIRTHTGLTLRFNEFLREVRATVRLAPCPNSSIVVRRTSLPLTDSIPSRSTDEVETEEAARRIAAALARQPDDTRLALDLFIVERMSAADVARTVGWPNAKTVYNRVYRALSSLRAELVRAGIGPHDL